MNKEIVAWLVLICLTCVECAAVVAGAPVADWTQWRGPNRNGQVQGPSWPERLREQQLRQQWRVELGPSYSGPLVVGERVYVTETIDRKLEVVRCLDRRSGKQLWETRWEGLVSVPFFAKSNGDWIRSTPAYSDGRLYVAGMRDVLVCLDANEGKELWRVDFVRQLDTPAPAFGFVSSPLVVDEALYVQAGASFAKMNKRTGEIVWRTLKDTGGMYGSAFSSPFHATVAGKTQLLVQTREELAGVDPENGEVLWSQEIPAFRGMNILTPTVYGDDSLFTSSYGGRSLLLRIQRGDVGYEVKEGWTNKLQGYMSSPVVVDGHIYVHLRNRRFACIDLESGEQRWVTKPFGKYWSLIAQNDRILALDQRGELLLIRANPEQFQLIDSIKISEDPTWAHLAVSANEIFVRELNGLAVYEWASTASQTAQSR